MLEKFQIIVSPEMEYVFGFPVVMLAINAEGKIALNKPVADSEVLTGGDLHARTFV